MAVFKGVDPQYAMRQQDRLAQAMQGLAQHMQKKKEQKREAIAREAQFLATNPQAAITGGDDWIARHGEDAPEYIPMIRAAQDKGKTIQESIDLANAYGEEGKKFAEESAANQAIVDAMPETIQEQLPTGLGESLAPLRPEVQQAMMDQGLVDASLMGGAMPGAGPMAPAPMLEVPNQEKQLAQQTIDEFKRRNPDPGTRAFWAKPLVEQAKIKAGFAAQGIEFPIPTLGEMIEGANPTMKAQLLLEHGGLVEGSEEWVRAMQNPQSVAAEVARNSAELDLEFKKKYSDFTQSLGRSQAEIDAQAAREAEAGRERAFKTSEREAKQAFETSEREAEEAAEGDPSRKNWWKPRKEEEAALLDRIRRQGGGDEAYVNLKDIEQLALEIERTFPNAPLEEWHRLLEEAITDVIEQVKAGSDYRDVVEGDVQAPPPVRGSGGR